MCFYYNMANVSKIEPSDGWSLLKLLAKKRKKKYHNSLQSEIPAQHLPRTIASSAIRMYMPYSAWRKYAARGSMSISLLISNTRGRGCITIMRRFARVISCGVRTSWPQHWWRRNGIYFVSFVYTNFKILQDLWKLFKLINILWEKSFFFVHPYTKHS